LGVEGNHLPHRTLVRLLEVVVVVVVLFRVVVDDKLATATWAVEHLAVNSSLPGFVQKCPSEKSLSAPNIHVGTFLDRVALTR